MHPLDCDRIKKVTAPGGLSELGDAQGAWETRVADVLQATELSPNLTAADEANATELRVPDWPAVPARIRACLGRKRADRLFDHRIDGVGDVGRLQFQEEYAEWRLVRGEDGPIRFELTTELSDYWELLARHVPQTAIDLVSEFARERVEPTAVFGDHDPFGGTSTEEERAAAFSEQMLGRDLNGGELGPPGPYNNGLKAITCLSQNDNSLGALVNLVAAAAAAPQLVIDADSGDPRLPSGGEAIPRLRPRSAQDCRHSDPVVVERIVRLATEGRLIRFDDPIGIYILDVQSHELVAPDGEPLPREWFTLSRQGPQGTDELSRHQRLVLEIPSDAGFGLRQMRARRTGELVTTGAQIAELVELGVYVRVSKRDEVEVSPTTHDPMPFRPCTERRDCKKVHQVADRLEETAG